VATNNQAVSHSLEIVVRLLRETEAKAHTRIVTVVSAGAIDQFNKLLLTTSNKLTVKHPVLSGKGRCCCALRRGKASQYYRQISKAQDNLRPAKNTYAIFVLYELVQNSMEQALPTWPLLQSAYERADTSIGHQPIILAMLVCVTFVM